MTWKEARKEAKVEIKQGWWWRRYGVVEVCGETTRLGLGGEEGAGEGPL